MKIIDKTCLIEVLNATNLERSRTTAVLLGSAIAISALFAGCSMVEQGISDEALPPEVVDVSNVPNAVPKPLPVSKYGNPASYVVGGKRYYTMPSSQGYKESGIASWYGTEAQGKRTSSGEIYENYGMTAAHRTLPLPSFVKVTNKQNGRSVIVKVNDRGPFRNNRLIDLSYVAAVKLGIVGYGTGLVEVVAIDPVEYERNNGPIIREAEAKDAASEPTMADPETVTAKAATDSAESTDSTVLATETVSEDRIAVDNTESAWKFWQWRPGKKTVADVAAEETASAVVASTPEAIQAAEETATIASETAESTPEALADSESNRWKFWQWRPGKTTTATADAAAEGATTAAVMAGTAATQATSDSVAVAATTAETTVEGGKSLWKFWQWRPFSKQADSNVSEQPEMAAETLASSAELEESAPTGDSNLWKFWQWRPGTKQAADDMAGEISSDAVIASAEDAAEESASEVPAAPVKSKQESPAASRPEPRTQQVASSSASGMYLQTGAFRYRENAERLRTHVDALAPGSFNIIETTGISTLYKIQIGPLQNRNEAMRISRQLNSVGIRPKLVNVSESSSMAATKRNYLSEQPRIDSAETKIRKKVVSAPVKQVMKPYRAPVVERPAAVPASKIEMPMAQMQSAVEPATAPAPAPTRRTGELALHQQAGAFRIRNNADRLRTRIVDEILEPTSITQELSDLTNDGRLVNLHKVQVGPLRDKAEAMRIRRALEPLGITDSFPVYRQR